MKKFIVICCTMILLLMSIFSAQATNNADPWSQIPDEIADALDDSLRKLTPARNVYIDEISKNHGTLLLDNGGEFGTVCVLEQDAAGKWRLIGVNDQIFPMIYLQEDTPAIWWGERFSVYTNVELTDDMYGNEQWTFAQKPDGTGLALEEYMDINIHEREVLYIVFPYMDGYAIGRINYHEGQYAAQRTLIFSLPNSSFEQFDPADFFAFIADALATQNNAPEIPVVEGINALPNPKEAKLLIDPLQTVLTGPAETYAKIMAKQASEQTWLQVFGRDGDYALVQYNAGDQENRFGYIPCSLVDSNDIPMLSWEAEPYVTTISLSLMDDPLRSRHAVGVLPAGTTVTRLATFGNALSYVESEIDGQTARGFVLSDFIVPHAEAPAEADEVKVFAAYCIDRYGKQWDAMSTVIQGTPQAEQFDILCKAVTELMAQGLTAETLATEYWISLWFDAYENTWLVSVMGNRFTRQPMDILYVMLKQGTGEILEVNIGGNG